MQLSGSSLPPKTLCLTFDDGPGETIGDGPGPKTIRLAEYLSEEGIFATFFMVGKFIEQYPHIPARVSDLGHIVGNHTYNHPQLTKIETGLIISEIATTDELIRDYNQSDAIYFRAPYGDWNTIPPQNPTVTEILNTSLKNNLEHYGSYAWDIGGYDWARWRDDISPKLCALEYLEQIKVKQKGILLVHDATADIPEVNAKNNGYEMVKILVPQLKSLGYNFVRLDKMAV